MTARQPTGLLRLTLSRLVLLVLVCLVAVPRAGLSTDPDRDYALGREAAEKGRWELAARLLVQAIDVAPRESKSPLSRAYLPHYFLGLSLYSMGDCDLALQHLRQSREDGVVMLTEHASELREMENRCAARARSLRQARRQIDSAQRLAVEVGEQAADPQLASYWQQGLPTPRLQFKEAMQVLERAERSLITESDLYLSNGRVQRIRSTSDDRIADANRLSSQVIELLQYLNISSRQAFGEVVVSRQDLLNEILQLRIRAVQVWGASSQPTGTDASGRNLASEYQRVTHLHLGDAEATWEQLEGVKAELGDFVDAVAKLPPRPRYRAPAPSPLRLAAEAYFAGQYDQVLSLLDEPETAKNAEQLAHYHLFRAAALYALYLIADNPDPELLSGAEENVRRCLEVKADLEPSAEAFSPRFIHFFREQAQPTSRERAAREVQGSDVPAPNSRVPGSR